MTIIIPLIVVEIATGCYQTSGLLLLRLNLWYRVNYCWLSIFLIGRLAILTRQLLQSLILWFKNKIIVVSLFIYRHLKRLVFVDISGARIWHQDVVFMHCVGRLVVLLTNIFTNDTSIGTARLIFSSVLFYFQLSLLIIIIYLLFIWSNDIDRCR